LLSILEQKNNNRFELKKKLEKINARIIKLEKENTKLEKKLVL